MLRLTATKRKSGILRILVARKGGTTGAELAEILDWARGTTDHWVCVMVGEGSIVRHGSFLTHNCLYTTPSDTLTRTPTARGRFGKSSGHKARATVIRSLLAANELTRGSIVRRIGLHERTTDRTIAKMARDGEIEPTAPMNHLDRRWRLVRVVRIAV
jgi:hypothetical protein